MSLRIVLPIMIFCVVTCGCLSPENTANGTLQVTSSPSGAEVYLDGQYQGSTPCTIPNVAMGNHTLSYRYQGYQSWSSAVTVAAGTSNFFAALQPLPGTSSGTGLPGSTAASPARVTIRAGSERMILGESNLFSGTCFGCTKVLLTLYGPGYYADGISLEPQKINSASAWSYTWNPGYSIQSGWYTMVAEDAQKTASDRVEFSVIGGGVVSISSNSYSAVRGDTLRLSGLCTSGAPSVLLVLFGPERFSSGIELGTASVTADKTWSFRYTLDNAMPTGLYTVYVYDIPRTSSGTTQFTVRSV